MRKGHSEAQSRPLHTRGRVALGQAGASPQPVSGQPSGSRGPSTGGHSRQVSAPWCAGSALALNLARPCEVRSKSILVPPKGTILESRKSPAISQPLTTKRRPELTWVRGSQVMPRSRSVQDPCPCLPILLGSCPALYILLRSKTFSRKKTWHLSLYLRAQNVLISSSYSIISLIPMNYQVTNQDNFQGWFSQPSLSISNTRERKRDRRKHRRREERKNSQR